ncbi:MAG: HAMP domain-containing protein [SAR324 cluster bacterium]|nr:HAMP domain-containing protein [SAR324 cluster bacterium]
MKKKKLIWQIYPSYLLITLLSLLAVVWYASNSFEEFFFEQTASDLRSRANLIESQFSDQQIFSNPALVDALCKELGHAGGMRVTVILSNGKVLGDTEKDPETMDDHANRPEIIDALSGKMGTSIRESSTLSKKMMYVAIPVSRDGITVGVLRISVPVTQIGKTLNSIQFRIFLQWGFIAAIAAAISLFIARRISRPLEEMRKGAERFAQGDLTHLLSIPQSEEIGELAETLNQMALLLNERMETVVSLENIRKDFVANVSHELKTPITSIKGSVETLLDGALDHREDAHRFLQIIARHTDRLNAIIDDLLTLARVEQNQEKVKLVFKETAVKKILLMAVEDCIQQAAEKNIEVILNCREELIVSANAPLLQQAFVNLISNAVKYSPSASEVEIAAERVDQFILIQVRDHGCGISASHLPRLFERFYRVDPARSRHLGGTGLGLAIVKHIVQTHQGKVEVESQLEKGSTFSIYLPVF